MKPRLSIRLVRLKLISPFTTSFGTQRERNALILELDSDGIKAYSECVTDKHPYYSYEDNVTALHIINRYLAKEALDCPEPREFLNRVRSVKGHNMAKAAIEMLLWDYHCKESGKPLHLSLGSSKGYAEVGISIGIDRSEKMIKRVSDAIEKGYRRIKVKIERGREREILQVIRDSFPDIPLSADANACYTYDDIDLIRSIDRFNLLYIEQPLSHDDLIYHSRLARQISTPICLDESISSVEKAKKAIEIGAASVINIKPGRLGGLANSIDVARIARENGCHVWIGGMLESGIGRAFNVSLASLDLIDYPGDTSPNDRYFIKDIVKNPFRMENGLIKPNTERGIGVILDQEFMDEVTLKSWRIF